MAQSVVIRSPYCIFRWSVVVLIHMFVQVIHRAWWYAMNDAKTGGGPAPESAPKRHKLQEGGDTTEVHVYHTQEELAASVAKLEIPG